MSLFSRSLRFLGVVGLGLVATACPPVQPPATATPTWTANHRGGPAVTGVTSQAGVLGTTVGWYGEVTQLTGNVEAASVVTLYPRTEPDGNNLGTGQILATSVNASVLGGGLLADHVLLVGGGGPNGWSGQFFRESGGQWTAAGLFSLPVGEVPRVLTDSMMVVQAGGGSPNQSMKVYDLPATGSVVPALAQTITAPPAWGSDAGLSFGGRVSGEGDVLVTSAIGSAGDHVGIYRRQAGQFSLESTLTSAGTFGSSVAVDDLGSTERIAIGARNVPSPGRVETYVSNGSSWSLESTLTQPQGLVDSDNGINFGDRVALDGSLLVVGERTRPLAPTSGGTARSVFVSSVFHKSSGAPWSFETSLEPVPVPLNDSDLNRGLPTSLVAGNHVVGTSFVGVSYPGCTFLCLSLRAEAWRFDRSPA